MAYKVLFLDVDGVLHGWASRSMQLHVKESSGFEVFAAAWSKGGVRVAVGRQKAANSPVARLVLDVE